MLALDLGSRRIGVAISDSERRVATPLEVVERGPEPALHRTAIASLAREWGVSLLLVGLPLSLDGSEGGAATAAREEAEALASATGLPVKTYDERFTTVTAEQVLRHQDLDGRRRREVVDMVAATVLLQSWLDTSDRRQAPDDDETHDAGTH